MNTHLNRSLFLLLRLDLLWLRNASFTDHAALAASFSSLTTMTRVVRPAPVKCRWLEIVWVASLVLWIIDFLAITGLSDATLLLLLKLSLWGWPQAIYVSCQRATPILVLTIVFKNRVSSSLVTTTVLIRCVIWIVVCAIASLFCRSHFSIFWFMDLTVWLFLSGYRIKIIKFKVSINLNEYIE